MFRKQLKTQTLQSQTKTQRAKDGDKRLCTISFSSEHNCSEMILGQGTPLSYLRPGAIFQGLPTDPLVSQLRKRWPDRGCDHQRKICHFHYIEVL